MSHRDLVALTSYRNTQLLKQKGMRVYGVEPRPREGGAIVKLGRGAVEKKCSARCLEKTIPTVVERDKKTEPYEVYLRSRAMEKSPEEKAEMMGALVGMLRARKIDVGQFLRAHMG